MRPTTLRTRRRLVWTFVVAGVAAPLLLAAARWPEWWTWIAPEQTPMTWLQSTTLVLAAAASVAAAHLLRLTGDDVDIDATDDAGSDGLGIDRDPPAGADSSAATGALPWSLLAAGLAALAIDERFALHERVRDGVLAPRDVTVPFLPWVGPGDFLLLAVGLVGLAVLPMVWRAMGDDDGARRALLVGVGLAVVAVGMDSIDPSIWATEVERVQQTAEEVVEYVSGLAMLAAVVLRLLGLLDGVTAAASPRRDAGSADGTGSAAPHSAPAPTYEHDLS